MNVLKLAALGAAVASLTACGGHTAAAPQPTATVTTTVTPKPKPAITPSRIVTLEDIIQACAYAMAKASQIELYESRPKACAPLGEPEFQRASNIAIPLIMAQYDTPAP
jgi:hypothetical protein